MMYNYIRLVRAARGLVGTPDCVNEEASRMPDSPRVTPEPCLDGEARDLGLDAEITRRDFLNAAMLGSGALLLKSSPPLGRLEPHDPINPDWDGFGGVGDYARSHGNTWATVSVAHRLRDGA